MEQSVLSQSVVQPAERFLDAGLLASSVGIREVRDSRKDFPGALSEQLDTSRHEAGPS